MLAGSLYHIYKSDGFNHVLFHMEKSGGWEYRFKQVGEDLPKDLVEWTEPREARSRQVVISPHARDYEVVVQWRDLGGRRWRQAALREVGQCWVDLNVTALEDVHLREFDFGKRDLRFVSMVRGGVAAFEADVKLLKIKAGESIVLKCRGVGRSLFNILVDGEQFKIDDGVMLVESVGDTRKNFKVCSGPAIGEIAEVNVPSFIVKSGGGVSEKKLNELKKGIKKG